MRIMVRHFKAHKPKVVGGHRPLAAVPARGSQAKEPQATPKVQGPGPVKEIGGPKGPEPTRYGDWERNGICVDF